jgi:ATP-dependent DNA ligase
VLHYVGGTSSFETAERHRPIEFLEPYPGSDQTRSGRIPGEPNRWASVRDINWELPWLTLVCEVAFEHLQGDRFPDGVTLLHWRHNKPPRECILV